MINPTNANTHSPAAIRLLRVNYDDGSLPLLLLDEGQDFESLFAEWCAMDDAFCEDLIPERCWQDVHAFLTSQGVTVIEPAAVQDLCEFYGLLDRFGD